MGVAWVARLGNHGRQGSARMGLIGEVDHGRLDVTCRSVRMRNVAVTGSQFSKATDEFQGVLPLLEAFCPCLSQPVGGTFLHKLRLQTKGAIRWQRRSRKLH